MLFRVCTYTYNSSEVEYDCLHPGHMYSQFATINSLVIMSGRVKTMKNTSNIPLGVCFCIYKLGYVISWKLFHHLALPEDEGASGWLVPACLALQR